VNYLVDTHAWIGFFDGREDFGSWAKALMIEEPEACVLSIASIWEAAIKVGVGKLKLPYDLQRDLPRILEENGFEVLGIDVADAAGVQGLEPIHGDPFDRLMVVQARRRGLTVISRDPVFERYRLSRVW
jgi:PIN domain nuclease of toxin-antitoxin system